MNQSISRAVGKFKQELKGRLRAAGIHLGISLCVAALAATLVFGVWYPYPYREISGGRELFLLVVSVDVVLGPLLTLAVFNRRKSWPHLRRDLALIGLMQLSALGYGLWTMAVARPVHLVFEIDRFRVVHRTEVPDELLHLAPEPLRAQPWWGPTLLSLRPFKDGQESLDMTMAAVQGVPLSARPELWRTYAEAQAEVLARATPLHRLRQRFPEQAAAIDAQLRALGRPGAELVTLPMIGRKSFWTALLDPITAQPLAFLPLDSF